jgi:hypothetical protein
VPLLNNSEITVFVQVKEQSVVVIALYFVSTVSVDLVVSEIASRSLRLPPVHWGNKLREKKPETLLFSYFLFKYRGTAGLSGEGAAGRARF